MSAADSVPVLPGTSPPQISRGRWNCWLYMLALPLTVVLFVVTVVGLATAPVTVGLLLLLLATPATRALANAYRREASRMLGQPVPAPYLEDRGANWLTRLAYRVLDPQFWRDLLWLLLDMTVGMVLATLSVSLFLLVPWYLIQPFLMAVTPEGIFDTNYGIVEVNSVATSFWQYVFVPIGFVLWWYGAPRLMQLHARMDAALLGPVGGARVRVLEQRVSTLAETRSEAVDVQAAELRRIERDLHDGAQARLVSSGMTLGMAAETLDDDPEAAKAMLAEAQATTKHALEELRSVARGIHPQVLADRGLVGGVRALAVAMTIPVHVTATLDGRPPAPVESAMYFAVAESLANIGKHAKARQVVLSLDHAGGALHVTVEDDGVGGARLDPEGGLAGIERRLGVFDGTLEVVSPAGGPTRLAMMVPCELSSERT